MTSGNCKKCLQRNISIIRLAKNRTSVNWLWKVIRVCFTTLWLVDKCSCHFLNQSEVTPKPIVTCSYVFPRDGCRLFAFCFYPPLVLVLRHSIAHLRYLKILTCLLGFPDNLGLYLASLSLFLSLIRELIEKWNLKYLQFCRLSPRVMLDVERELLETALENNCNGKQKCQGAWSPVIPLIRK